MRIPDARLWRTDFIRNLIFTLCGLTCLSATAAYLPPCSISVIRSQIVTLPCLVDRSYFRQLLDLTLISYSQINPADLRTIQRNTASVTDKLLYTSDNKSDI